MTPFPIEKLAKIIATRGEQNNNESYTARLLQKGSEHCARKFAEEAIELVVAITGKSAKEQIIAEAADVIYHLLVVLHSSKVSLAEVENILEKRSSQSGLEEKKQRTKNLSS